ncbi:MAG: acetate kinase [Cyanobacteria bacterium]|nr:acetate kinase [Cyanobacteriota bacterium]
MHILVLNAGSSSQKSELYDLGAALPPEPPTPIWSAQLDWHDADAATLTVKTGDRLTRELAKISRSAALSQLLSTLWQGPTQVIPSLEAIDGVGHRVVHGGQDYRASVVITPEVKAEIARLSCLAPNHNPANLEGIELMEQRLGDVPQVAVFDTAFHSQMPPAATTYSGPYDWLNQGIRRYGFHGIRHQYCAQRAAELLGRDLAELRLVICHLGNGCSLSAVKGGHSIDTTMGFTPLDGLMMGTRSGSVDPGILIHLMRQGYTADQLDQMLNKDSGLKGISGVSHDWRQIEQAIAQGNDRATLARDMYLHSLKAHIGAMIMGLGGVDAIVFTAGIGEHAASVRTAVGDSLAFLGARIDAAKNDASPVDADIATAESTVRMLVIHTQEDWAIAKDCWRCLNPKSQHHGH